MIDFDAWQTGLKALVATLCELPPELVIFDGESAPSPVGDVQALARIMIFGLVNVGQTDCRKFAEAVDGDNGPLYETVGGQRALTLRVKVESYDQRPTKRAVYFIANLQRKLQATSTNDALDALGLAYRETLTFVDASQVIQSRMQPFGLIDLRLNTTDQWTDPVGYSRISTGEVTQAT